MLIKFVGLFSQGFNFLSRYFYLFYKFATFLIIFFSKDQKMFSFVLNVFFLIINHSMSKKRFKSLTRSEGLCFQSFSKAVSLLKGLLLHYFHKMDPYTV